MRTRRLIPFLLLPLLAACSKEEAPQTSTQQSAATSAPAAPAATTPDKAPAAGQQAQAPSAPAAAGGAAAKGEDVYKQTCTACHATGVAGAPKLGDKADWEPRIAQGKDVLYEHSIKGYTGKKGVMPPKGGNMSLSDEQVKAAVDYMVAQAK
ncbi:hypothetical protein SVA_1419 [Sulfurifustis variabilis]|uniref:Cytochrome c domain-containing protein n=1 Tax=Sulfurifustis variabilis TaxID=1675686 RepID=A0A1B4V948_9GAMM|nr:c-type cytochrome [Sulfurifustis variabilis]BAU47984.1 hypothetical protein SVA_1419 [Sulfurifustis variabilis]